MPEYKQKTKCNLCGNEFLFGHGNYEGKPLKLYGNIMACNTCWISNRDGWAPQFEKTLLIELKRFGKKEPKRNEKGLLPRE
ncbi:MAG TPA: hypothetical protein VN944_08365 [Nitrospiria bacterium]|nr:hypothetical protein [Nitrospiria bacterium]